MDETAIARAAQAIWTNWQAATRIDQLPENYRPATRTEGYRVQAEVARQSGQKLFGWKIAATSAAGQTHIGVDGPLAGRLLEKRIFRSGDRVPLTNSIMNVAEAEFAFRMGHDLPPRQSPYDTAEVLQAVAMLHPAIEIPDSRYHDFAGVGAAQLIADNACANYFVLGPAADSSWRDIDLAAHAVIALVNEKPVREGKGANVLGDPRIALTWLANELSRIGITLGAGQVVTTGTCVVPVEIRPGDHVFADFGPLGTVEARLVP